MVNSNPRPLTRPRFRAWLRATGAGMWGWVLVMAVLYGLLSLLGRPLL